jgi:hypothetical protein
VLHKNAKIIYNIFLFLYLSFFYFYFFCLSARLLLSHDGWFPSIQCTQHTHDLALHRSPSLAAPCVRVSCPSNSAAGPPIGKSNLTACWAHTKETRLLKSPLAFARSSHRVFRLTNVRVTKGSFDRAVLPDSPAMLSDSLVR